MAVADTVFYGGSIITVDDNNGWEAEAVAVKGGKIIAVGKHDQVFQQAVGAATQHVDLQGKTMLPAFIENHTHVSLSASIQSMFIDIGAHRYKTYDDVVRRLKQAALETPIGKWIGAFGLDILLTTNIPSLNKHILDSISNEHPIFISASNAHQFYVNSMALEKAEITEDILQSITGNVIKDANGQYTGEVLEAEAAYLFVKAMDFDIGPKVVKQKVINHLNDHLRKGYTVVADLHVGSGWPFKLDERLKVWLEAASDEKCKVHMYGYLFYQFHKDLEGDIDKSDDGHRSRIMGPKFWMDGSPFVGSAAVKEPYLENEITTRLNFKSAPNVGEENIPKETLIEEFRLFHKEGLQIAVHTQGDRCIDTVLDAFETVLNESPQKDHRHRLEHCGLITKDQLKKVKKLGITVSFLFAQLTYYGTMVSKYILGKERTQRWAPAQSATDLGVKWTLHHDHPCFPDEPLLTMQTAVTRLPGPYTNGKPAEEEPYGAGECTTIEDAIRGFTINAAWQLFLEKERGSIEVGKVADFTILSENPREVDKKKIGQIKVVSVYKDGQCEYSVDTHLAKQSSLVTKRGFWNSSSLWLNIGLYPWQNEWPVQMLQLLLRKNLKFL